jgi:hypothetical protein
VIDPLKTSNSSNHSEINVNHTLVPSTHFHESPSQSPVLPSKSPINHSNETNDSYVETGKNETNLMTKNCTDQNEPFVLGNGSAPIKNCKWISEHSKAQRCKRPEVAKRCPFTCGLCPPDKPHHPTMYPSIVPLDPHHTMSPSQGKDMDEHDDKDCVDAMKPFPVGDGSNSITCKWVSKKNKANRCMKDPEVGKHCPVTCGMCGIGKPNFLDTHPSSLHHISVTSSPVIAPSSYHHTLVPQCADARGEFPAGENGTLVTCKWVSKKNKVNRCRGLGVAKHCPFTCGLCHLVQPHASDMSGLKMQKEMQGFPLI